MQKRETEKKKKLARGVDKKEGAEAAWLSTMDD